MTVNKDQFDGDTVLREGIHLTKYYSSSLLIGAAAFAVAMAAPVGYVRDGAGLSAAAEKKFSTDAVKTTLRRVNGLETQVQRITVEMAQIALDLDKAAGFERLQKAYNQFEHTLSILARGDAAIGIPAPSDPAIKAALDDVRVAWSIFKTNVLQTILDKSVTRANVFVLVALEQTVNSATTQAKRVYREKFLKRTMVSLNTLTLVKAERQSYLAAKLATEFWLIALDYEVPRLRPELGKNAKLFSRVLTGLSKGDPELQLFPIDDPALHAVLRRTQAAWERVLPHIDSVVEGRAPSTDTRQQVKADMEALRDTMDKVVSVLGNL